MFRPLAPLLCLLLTASMARAGAPQLRPSTEPGDGKTHSHSLTDIPDMSRAVPADEIGRLPSSQDRYRTLKTQADREAPKVEDARSRSAALTAEAAALRQRLIETAARVLALEADKSRLDEALTALAAREQALSASFAHDRVAVAHLLGLLERMQHDMPPVLVLSAGDALAAAHSTMLLGASLPKVYGAAADLARRLQSLRQTRTALIARRRESAANALALATARGQLDQLLAKKQAEADTAASQYESLAGRYEMIAQQASDLGQLLTKVAAIRAEAGKSGLNAGPKLAFAPHPGALQRPVSGPVAPGGIEGVGGAAAPGVSFSASPGGQVVAPADGKVLFAGPYHKTGRVLILELGGGYDLVLAGLGSVSVRGGDGVLAGEPLGTMPPARDADRLYLELRQGNRAMSPMPWLETSLRKAEKS